MTEQRYVLSGLSRITVRVARLLAERDAKVQVVTTDLDHELAAALPPEVELQAGELDQTAALEAAALPGAACLLALSDDDIDNLRAVACAAALAPDVPIVLRTFEPALAEQLQQSGRVRRAYSVSALAAPAFVAAALGQQVVETLRLGDDTVPLCRVVVDRGSPLSGLTSADVTRRFGCEVVARRDREGDFAVVDGSDRSFSQGDEMLVGGHLEQVLRLAVANRDAARNVKSRRSVRRKRRPNEPRTPRSVQLSAFALAGVFAVASVVLALALDIGLVDALYRAVTIGWGDSALAGEPAWLELFGVGTMVAVGVLVGILFSHVAAVATAERLDVLAERRAARAEDHVILAGLGNVGYRIVRLLATLDLPVVVIEREENSRFTTAIGSRTPVLVGDASLPENLERAGVERARCILAVTGDDVANLSACLHSQRMNRDLRAVARVFDDTLVEHAGTGLGVDAVVSASRVAEGAFFGAATDERAMRHFDLNGLPMAAVRVSSAPAPAPAGVRVVAVDPTDGAAVVAGAEASVEALIRS